MERDILTPEMEPEALNDNNESVSEEPAASELAANEAVAEGPAEDGSVEEPIDEPTAKEEITKPAPDMVPLKKIVKILVGIFLVLICAIIGLKLGLDRTPAAAEDPAAEEAAAEQQPVYHPLTGLELAAVPSDRLLCVSVDNSPEARPQSGVGEASLVYEVPAEAHIPRLILFFYAAEAENIGPVRSARPYIVNTARGYGGLLAHCGWSPEAEELLNTGVVDFVNELNEGDYFWRSSNRTAPHNLYTSTENLNQALNDLGYSSTQELPSFSFRRDGEQLSGPAVSSLTLGFESARTSYVYDPNRQAYARFISDRPYCDAESGKQIFAANVIVQYVSSTVMDEEGRLNIDLLSGGDALLFTNGVVIPGHWTRAGLDAPTVFSDVLGNEFSLLPGQTWIEMVDDQVAVDYELPEQAADPEEDAAEEEAQ